MKRLWGLLPLLAALGFLTGCGRDAYLVDDVDQSLQSSIGELLTTVIVTAMTPPNPFDDPDYSPEEDRIHQPYAIGASIGFTLYDEDEQASDLRLESANPSIMRVESQASGRATCVAVNPGVVAVRAVDRDDDVIGEWNLEVAEPDEVELVPYARERAGKPYRFADGENPQVAVGGTSTFEVRYTHQGRRLWGQSDFYASSPDSDIASVYSSQSSLTERADWLQVTPSTSGAFTVDIMLNDTQVDSLSFEAVDDSAASTIELVDDARVGTAAEGTNMVLVAQAFDLYGAPIFGAESSWTFDGDDMSGRGEVFLYSYDPSVLKSVRAEVGTAQSSSTMIHASHGHVEGDSSIGCAISAPSSSDRGLLLAPLLVLVFRLRRRRRHGDGASL